MGVDFTCDVFDLWVGGDSVWNYSFMVNGPVLAALAALGILGNILVLLALRPSCYGTAPRLHLFLRANALWDCLLIVTAAAVYSGPTLYFGRMTYLMGYYSYALPPLYFVLNATLVGSVWMVLTLAMDRYIAVCHPLRHRRLLEGRDRVRPILVTVSVAAFAYSIPTVFEFTVDTCSMPRSNATAIFVHTTEYRQSLVYYIAYHVVSAAACYSALPLLVLFALSLRIAAALGKATTMRLLMTQTQTRTQTQEKPSAPRYSANSQTATPKTTGRKQRKRSHMTRINGTVHMRVTSAETDSNDARHAVMLDTQCTDPFRMRCEQAPVQPVRHPSATTEQISAALDTHRLSTGSMDHRRSPSPQLHVRTALTTAAAAASTSSRGEPVSLTHYTTQASPRHNSRETREPAGGKARRRYSVLNEAMLITLFAKFLVTRCFVPLVNIIELMSVADDVVWFNKLVDMINCIIVLNSSTNVLVFLAFSRRFRAATARLFEKAFFNA